MKIGDTMGFLNVEIKARIDNPDRIRSILRSLKAEFKGIDHQIDTYFNVPNGRLKLREGTIENNLIHYHRVNQSAPKASHYSLYRSEPDSTLKAILTDALGVFKIVDKHREIYYIDNVKFHIDRVEKLGAFFEIEAIDRSGSLPQDQLMEQCYHYLKVCEIPESDLLSSSYSDML